MTFLIQGFLSLMIQLVPIDRDLGEMFMSCTGWQQQKVEVGMQRCTPWARCSVIPLLT